MLFPRRNLKSHDAPAHVVHVVNPSGTIKSIQVSHTIDSPILDRVFTSDAEGGVHLATVRVAQAFEQKGWVLLEDLFRQDGPEGEDRFKDFLAYQAYASKCEAQGVRPKPYPADQLPDEIEARRGGQAPMAPTWTPKAKPKAASKKKHELAEVQP